MVYKYLCNIEFGLFIQFIKIFKSTYRSSLNYVHLYDVLSMQQFLNHVIKFCKESKEGESDEYSQVTPNSTDETRKSYKQLATFDLDFSCRIV